MQTFKNDHKRLSLLTWPTSDKEMKENPVIKFRILKSQEINIGDEIEVSSYKIPKTNLVRTVTYRISKIILDEPSKSWDNQKIMTCNFERVILN